MVISYPPVLNYSMYLLQTILHRHMGRRRYLSQPVADPPRQDGTGRIASEAWAAMSLCKLFSFGPVNIG